MGFELLARVPDVYWGLALAFALLLVFGFRERIRAWFDRLEAKVAARHAQNARERQDPHAHFHLTLAEIEARTPAPEPTPFGGRWRFGGSTYATFEEADDARREAILREARGFYVDVDRLRLGRG